MGSAPRDDTETMPRRPDFPDALLCTASIWLAALAVRSPGGSHGRGMAAAGIVLAILGFAFCLFAWAIGSILIHDNIL